MGSCFILVFGAVISLSLAHSKIDIGLGSVLKSKGTANIAISFADTGPILTQVSSLKFGSNGERNNYLKDRLQELQQTSQQSALEYLKIRVNTFQSFWINNQIYVQNAGEELVKSLAALSDVVNIREEVIAHVSGRNNETRQKACFAGDNWGLDKIEARRAWSLNGGNQGRGVIVGSIHSGVRSTHQTLKNNYRCEYGWFDPYSYTQDPFDDLGDGTHLMGTTVGSSQLGVAPASQWMACRGCENGVCYESLLVACGEFVVCPTLYDGTNQDCSKSPDIVMLGVGVDKHGWYDSVLNTWECVGIIPFSKTGDDGPSCETIQYPASSSKVISAGCTTRNDELCSSSSRGPTEQGRIKPDIAAPGMDILSAWHLTDTCKTSQSGTNSAMGHAAGVAALLLSRNPSLSFREIKTILRYNTDQNLRSGDVCGSTSADQFPNNIFGYGRINAKKAMEAVIDLD